LATPTPLASPIVSDALVRLGATTNTFSGGQQAMAWTNVSVLRNDIMIRWDATSSSSSGCRVGYRLKIEGSAPITGTIRLDSKERKTGSRLIETHTGNAALTVESTCAAWAITMTDGSPPPAPKSGGEGGSGGSGSSCHPSYEGACLKVGAGDYDCAGGSGNGPNYVVGPVSVVGPDDFDLDRDGDGVGCEG
jgi:hypothetical protein